MAHFFAIALSFPAVLYSVLLGAALVYWAFVLVGAASVDLFGEGGVGGEGADGATDAIGHGHAAIASAKGAAEGAADHVAGDHAEGALAGMLAALRLRSAPATVVVSCVVLFAWVFSMLGVLAAEAWLAEGARDAARFAVFGLAPLLALVPTSVLVRPLARLFVPAAAAAHAELVGKVCTIRTGTVTDRFGEATLDDGGAGVVVRVRIDTGDTLARGDHAVIVAYDEATQEFTVAPLAAADEALAPRRDIPRK